MTTFRLAGVMGWPVAHSRSPLLHGYWLERYGIRGAYLPLPVPPDRLADVLRALPLLGYRGANLTVPHKTAALASLDRIDPEARRLGSVNTVVVEPDGSLRGLSTDGYGFMQSLQTQATRWRPGAAPVAVLGAGGAARAIAGALFEAGETELRIVNRSPEHAADLAAVFPPGMVVPFAWADRAKALADCRLLVNATTLGMQGEPPLDLALDALPRAAIVMDIVYKPLITPLLAAAAARGNAVIDGLWMLLHQARPAFAAWFGIDPEVDGALRDRLVRSLEA